MDSKKIQPRPTTTKHKHGSTPIRKHLPVRAKFQIMTIKKDKQSGQRWAQEKSALDLLLQSIIMEGTLKTIDGGNIDDALSDITESLMQAASPQPTKRISNLGLTGTTT